MEAGAAATPSRVAPARPASSARSALLTPFAMVWFCARAVFELRGVWRYTAEILRQAGILIVGTMVVLLFTQMVFGGVCGFFANYGLRSIGASDAVGLATSNCTRQTPLLMVGYILSAKVGCGLVAEIGSMKISEELDAFRSVGLDPMRFVVATRLAAIWIVLPLFYFTSQLAAEAGAYIGVVGVVGEVSQGTWEGLHWGLRSSIDYWKTLISFFTISTGVVLVAMYYGYTVKPEGGPVGVGAATARSMVINLVLVHVLFLIVSLIFYGSDLGLPIGG